MGYPAVLGALAAFFGFIAILSKFVFPEPPPRGGVVDKRAAKVSFAEFHAERIRNLPHQDEAVYGQQQRRSA